MISLNLLKKEDLPYRVNLLNNEGISPYLNTSEKFTIDKTVAWFESIKDNSLRKDFVFLLEGEKVGMGGLTNISLQNRNCELYMYMDPKSQGKGLGYNSCYQLCNFAFNQLNLNKVFLYTFSENYRANSLYEKVGFKLEGVLREHTLKDDKLRDRNFYGILKKEFKTI